MKQAAKNPMAGIREMVFRATGTPHRSARYPRRVTPIPPVPMANPAMRPEATPRLWGNISWAITTVTEKLETRTNPESPRMMITGQPVMLRKASIRGNVIPMVIKRKFL